MLYYGTPLPRPRGPLTTRGPLTKEPQQAAPGVDSPQRSSGARQSVASPTEKSARRFLTAWLRLRATTGECRIAQNVENDQGSGRKKNAICPSRSTVTYSQEEPPEGKAHLPPEYGKPFQPHGDCITAAKGFFQPQAARVELSLWKEAAHSASGRYMSLMVQMLSFTPERRYKPPRTIKRACGGGAGEGGERGHRMVSS